MVLDKELVNLRIDIIERNIKEINNIVKEGKVKYLENYRTQLAARHALLESIEACIDIANHIIASLSLRRPEDYKDVFVVLEENKIISKNLSKRLQEMAKFRNLLVHHYTKIDEEKVFNILKKDVKDIVEFIKTILRLIKR
jgi:uncharacterized protein YutE (UPF0331/DUF86 family)